MSRRVTTSERGFTLLELLVVMVVLGLIASVGVNAAGAWSKRYTSQQENEKLDRHLARLQLLAARQGQALVLVVEHGHDQTRITGAGSNFTIAGNVDLKRSHWLRFPLSETVDRVVVLPYGGISPVTESSNP